MVPVLGGEVEESERDLRDDDLKVVVDRHDITTLTEGSPLQFRHRTYDDAGFPVVPEVLSRKTRPM